MTSTHPKLPDINNAGSPLACRGIASVRDELILEIVIRRSKNEDSGDEYYFALQYQKDMASWNYDKKSDIMKHPHIEGISHG
jgi:hypothetical protein